MCLYKILLVKLNNFHSLACLKLNQLWHNKTETKNAKVAKMVKFIKIYTLMPRKFNFGNFFNTIILPPLTSLLGKNRSLEKVVGRNG